MQTTTDISIQEEWPNEDDEGNLSYDERRAYVLCRVHIDGVEYRIGACVGVPEYLDSTADAAGSIVGLATAWWTDASDWQDLPDIETRDEVLEHLKRNARRLLREAIELRLILDRP